MTDAFLNIYPLPGSIEFRRFVQKQYPRREGEPVSQWLKRINRECGISPSSRLSKLYYDQGKDNARFTPEEIQVLFLSAYPAALRRQHPLNEKNNRDLEEIEALKRELKNDLVGQIADALKSIVHALEAGAR